jgi:predicted TIM-barrel fold metal-dependent hydrolase
VAEGVDLDSGSGSSPGRAVFPRTDEVGKHGKQFIHVQQCEKVHRRCTHPRFPENIAKKVVDSVHQMGFKPYGTGTIQDLERQMAESGVSHCVVLAIATLPRLVELVNIWLLKNKKPFMIAFGTIHPEYQDYRKELHGLKSMGAKVVKFSSLFQNLIPDDRAMYPIYEVIREEGLAVLFHAGSGMHRNPDEDVQSSPKRLRKVLEDFPGITMIAAHWRGLNALEEASEYLWGEDVYLDTSYPPGLKGADQERILEFIEQHGSSHILFASDLPFGDQKEDVQVIQGLPIAPEEKFRILYDNAAELFGLDSE